MARTFRQIPRIQGVDTNLAKILEPMRDMLEQLVVGNGRAIRVSDVGAGLAFTKNKLRTAATAGAIGGTGVDSSADIEELQAQIASLIGSAQQFRTYVDQQLAAVSMIALGLNALELDNNGYVIGISGGDVPGDDVEEIEFTTHTNRFSITRPAERFALDTAYNLGMFVTPSVDADISTGLIYEVTVAGTTDDTDEPDWSTADSAGETVTSGTVTFTARTPPIVYPFDIGDVDGVDGPGIDGAVIIDRSVRDLSLSTNVALLDRDEQEWTGDNRYIGSASDQLTVGDIGTDGYVALSRATGATAPGYARFYNAAGTSRGYVGFHDGSSRITLTSENGWGIRVDSDEDNYFQADTFNRLLAPGLQIGQADTVPFLSMNGTTPYLAAGGSGSGDAFWLLQRYNNATGGPDIGMYHSRGASIGTHTILAQNDEIGSISFYASDGTSTPVKVARIIGFINAAVSGATDLGSRISILTTPDGSATSQVTAFFSPEESEFNSTLFDFNGAMDVQSTSGIVALQVSSGYLAVSGSSSSGTIAMLAQNALPRIGLLETDAAADNQLWYVYANAERFNIGAVNDARSVVTNAFFIDRTGTTIDLVRIDATEFEVNATTIDFNGTMDVSLALTIAGATGLGNSGIASGGDITVSKTSASLYLHDSAGDADEDVYRLANITGNLFLQTRTDANAAGVNIMQVTRTGTTVDLIQFNGTELEFNGTTLDLNGNLDVSGTLLVAGATTYSGAFSFSNTQPTVRFIETDAAANNQVWDIFVSAETWNFRVINDALSSGVTWLQVNRTANTVDSIELAATSLVMTGVMSVAGRITAGANGAQSEVLRLVANDTLGDCYISFYEDDNSTRKAYMAFGNTGDDAFYIANEEAAGTILLQTNATTRFRVNANGTIDLLSSAQLGVPSGWSLVSGGGTLTISGTGETLATFADDGAVTLYYDNTARIATTSTGASVTGVLNVSSTLSAADVFLVSGGAPELRIRETDGASNEQYWLWLYSGGTLTLRAYNDALNASSIALSFDRTGNTVDLVSLFGTEVELNGTTLDFNGNMDLSGAMLATGVVTPTALSAGDNDNVDLGVGSVVRARISGNATTSNLTSVSGGSDGKLLILTNISANTIMIINEDTGGTAANRFAINGDMVLPQNCSALFVYDGNIQRWTRLN